MAAIAFLAGLLLVAVGVRLVRVARRQRAARLGRCATCDYFIDDIRPRALRCPECGATIQSRNDEDALARINQTPATSTGGALVVFGGVLALATATDAWNSAVRLGWMMTSTDYLIGEVGAAANLQDDAYKRVGEELRRRWTSGRLTQPQGRLLGQEIAELISRSTSYSLDELTAPSMAAIAAETVDPVSIMVREGAVAYFSDPATPPAWWLDELMARALSSGAITEAERSAIVATALSAIVGGRQTTHMLSSAMGDEIAEGRVPLAAFIHALHMSLRPSVVIRPDETLRPDETFVFGVDLGVRAGYVPVPFAVQLELAGDAADWDRWQSLPGPPEAMWQASSSTWASTRAGDIPQISTMVRAPSTTGVYDIEARVTIWFSRLAEADHHEFDTITEDDIPIGAFSFVVRSRLRVADEPFPPPRLVETPFDRPDFGDCDRCGNYAWRSPRSDAVGVKLLLDKAPVDVAAQVLLEQDGAEHPIGWVFLPAGRSAAVVSGRAAGIEPGPVRIVLRSDTRPLATYDPQRLLYEKDLVIPTKVWGLPPDTTE
jgi:hypothetical protein